MKAGKISNRLSIAMTIVAIVLFASSVSRAANRTWVALSGDDSNPCSNAKPCKTFTGALAKTSAGGEIVVKESGNFGAVTIDKSITIDAGGKYAGIQAGSGNNAVTIQAGNTDVIVLRGLTIKGLGVGVIGIDAAASNFGGILHVENCAISDFTFAGIGAGAGMLFVQDTVISECDVAINMHDGRALIEHTRLENNGAGISMVQGAQVTVRRTVASGNQGPGFSNFWGTLNLENCVASNNGVGVSANGNNPSKATIVVISNSVVTNNQLGLWQAISGVIYSRGNNTVTGNNTDINGTITPLGGS